MPISPATLPRMTVEAYLKYEASQDTRHELVDGYLYAMTGASDRHERISMNLLTGLLAKLKGSRCRAYKSDMKVAVGDDYFYPDIFVACGEVESSSFSRRDPVVIIEILSPTTQRYDRGDKRLAYETIPSLKQYVLISQDEQRVEVRDTQSGTVDLLNTEAQLLTLTGLEFSITLAEIYA